MSAPPVWPNGLLLAQTQITGGGGGGNVPPTIPIDPPWPFLAACMAVVVAGYLLRQSAQLQKWAFVDEKGAPSHIEAPILGFVVAALTGVIGTVWIQMQRGLYPTEAFEKFVVNPTVYMPVPLLMAAPLSALACYTFIVAAFGLSGRRNMNNGGHGWSWPILGAMTALLNFAASVGKLLTLY